MKIVKIILIHVLLLTSLSADVRSFPSIQEALDTLIQALETRDKKSLEEFLTPAYKEVVKIKNIDSEDIDNFLKAYKKSHRLAYYGWNEIYLEVGQHHWNFPIPIVHKNNAWSFDIDLGIDNMLTRLIGKYELDIIEALELMTYEELLTSDLVEMYTFTQDEDRVVARPVSYNKTGYMSFVRTEEKKIFEADLKEELYLFDSRFKEVQRYYLKNQ